MVKHTCFFLCIYEITYKLHETREASQLKKLYPLQVNTITRNGANAIQTICSKTNLISILKSVTS